jgi:hypothetical protein
MRQRASNAASCCFLQQMPFLASRWKEWSPVPSWHLTSTTRTTLAALDRSTWPSTFTVQRSLPQSYTTSDPVPPPLHAKLGHDEKSGACNQPSGQPSMRHAGRNLSCGCQHCSSCEQPGSRSLRPPPLEAPAERAGALRGLMGAPHGLQTVRGGPSNPPYRLIPSPIRPALNVHLTVPQPPSRPRRSSGAPRARTPAQRPQLPGPVPGRGAARKAAILRAVRGDS